MRDMDKYSINSCCSLWYKHSSASMCMTSSYRIKLLHKDLFLLNSFVFLITTLKNCDILFCPSDKNIWRWETNKHKTDTLCSTQQTMVINRREYYLHHDSLSQRPTMWQSATVDCTGAVLSVGYVTTHYVAIKTCVGASVWCNVLNALSRIIN